MQARASDKTVRSEKYEMKRERAKNMITGEKTEATECETSGSFILVSRWNQVLGRENWGSKLTHFNWPLICSNEFAFRLRFFAQFID